MELKNNSNRWRCLTSGCNPHLNGEDEANLHSKDFEHRVAKWPVRSKSGQAKAVARNKSGYYDKYNDAKKLVSKK